MNASNSVIPVDTTVAPKVKSNRKTQRDELMSTWRFRRPEELDTSRFVKMAPRAARRASKHMEFRPVYGHQIAAADHKSLIRAMKVKDRRTAMVWAPTLRCAMSMVTFGLAVKRFVLDYTTTNRHNAMKAAGTWVQKPGIGG